MRAIEKRNSDGSTEKFVALADVKEHLDTAAECIAAKDHLIQYYTLKTEELSSAWEQYRKDPHNLKLFFELSGKVQSLAAIAMELRRA